MPNFKSFWILIFFILNACSESEQKISTEQYVEEIKKDIYPRPKPNPDKNAYFGDLHVHTANSFDAYTFGTISTPADAYRFCLLYTSPSPRD